MANIEFHGGYNFCGTFQTLLARKLREMGMENEIVITGLDSYPYYGNYYDTTFKPAPFLRICGETKEEIEKAVDIVKGIGLQKKFDIETVLVNSFIPKEE